MCRQRAQSAPWFVARTASFAPHQLDCFTPQKLACFTPQTRCSYAPKLACFRPKTQLLYAPKLTRFKLRNTTVSRLMPRNLPVFRSDWNFPYHASKLSRFTPRNYRFMPETRPETTVSCPKLACFSPRNYRFIRNSPVSRPETTVSCPKLARFTPRNYRFMPETCPFLAPKPAPFLLRGNRYRARQGFPRKGHQPRALSIYLREHGGKTFYWFNSVHCWEQFDIN